MATPWDRAARGYFEEWVPRFTPYHLDLIQEAKLEPGHRVLIACAGPGSEVLAAARAVGETGRVRATDRSAELLNICCQQADAAGLENVYCEQADAADASGGPWDVVFCAFGLWGLDDRVGALKSWARALAPAGKVVVMTWGPTEDDDPFERVSQCLQHFEPDFVPPSPRILSQRDAMAQMFEEAELSMVRHTVFRHTLTFKRAEEFFNAMRETTPWCDIWDRLGDASMSRVAARFYGLVGGPDAPLSWDPPATLAIAGLPGDEIEVASRRTSVHVPLSKGSTPNLK
ncbi:class I SAM-dependent methyltransferase [Pendulispora albinea]|uniref:Class I SAM-dependent methyltransferase n=1 Tax=Pendulispora albinea TaxID=2741071 RepID=A0ABZ2LRE0_9BACT